MKGIRMKPYWIEKTDPARYPVRALAKQWQDLLASNFGVQAWLSKKEWGQLRDLQRFLGEWTPFVIEWMTVAKHWRHFTESIRLEVPKIQIPLYPHIGFLLQQRTRAMKIMREYLRDSESPAAIRFVAEQDLIARKNLLEARLLLSGDKPEQLSEIAAASTPAEIQRVLAEITDESAEGVRPSLLTNGPVG
jgi:hypothetical protein